MAWDRIWEVLVWLWIYRPCTITVLVWASLVLQRWRMCGGKNCTFCVGHIGTQHVGICSASLWICVCWSILDVSCCGMNTQSWGCTLNVYPSNQLLTEHREWLVCVCCCNHARHHTTGMYFQHPLSGFWNSVLQMHRQLSRLSSTQSVVTRQSHSECGHLLCCVCLVRSQGCYFVERTKSPS